MKKYILYLFIISTGFFVACENELPYRPGGQETKLILNALLEADKKENDVFMNLSYAEETDYIKNGIVTLFVNGEEKETVEAVPQWWAGGSEPEPQKVCRLTTILHPGDQVRLEASADSGRYHARAEVEIPQPVGQIQVDTFLTRQKIGLYMQDCMQFKITLNDRPGEKNYYQLVIQKGEYWGDVVPEDWLPDTYQEIINQEDVVLTDGHLTTGDDDEYNILDMSVPNKYNVFTDTRFPDASYTLKVYTSYNDPRNNWGSSITVVDFAIQILSITESQYRYFRALNLLESENYEPPFMEPVIIPSNVQGGLGFVGTGSGSQIRLRTFDKTQSKKYQK